MQLKIQDIAIYFHGYYYLGYCNSRQKLKIKIWENNNFSFLPTSKRISITWRSMQKNVNIYKCISKFNSCNSCIMRNAEDFIDKINFLYKQTHFYLQFFWFKQFYFVNMPKICIYSLISKQKGLTNFLITNFWIELCFKIGLFA